jgi:hypothetical protein
MRHLRLHLRSSNLLILTTFTFFIVLTLHTKIWSTTELELQERFPEPPKPPGAVPIWSAFNQLNIYDIHALPSNRLINRPTYITAIRIDELFQLVRNARNEQTNLFVKEKPNSIGATWSFQRFAAQKVNTSQNDTNTHIETGDSAAMKVTLSTKKVELILTTIEKRMNDQDKMQLRDFIHRVITKWKEEHRNDKIVSLADIMHDSLAQDEPA